MSKADVCYWSVFSKLNYEVSGLGFECSISKTEWTFTRTILGDFSQSSERTIIQLDREGF